MDAIALLKADHKEVADKFAAFEGLGDRAFKAKAKIVNDVIAALSRHAAIEEAIVYPAARERLGDSADKVLEALEEHHIVKWTLSELDQMAPNEERFTAKFTVLMENVRHHVTEEEKVLFPALRKAFSKAELEQMGEELAEAKRSAPSRPHPRSPDEPPLNAPGQCCCPSSRCVAGRRCRRAHGGPQVHPQEVTTLTR